MPRSVTLKLVHEAQLKLQQIVDRGGDWRERQRANTLILLGNGRSLKEVAIAVGINIRTVGLTRMDWLRRGFDSLKDAVRCGAPRKITLDELIRLKDAATKEPLTSTALLAKHIEGGGQSVHVNTIKRALKRANFVWKRTRSSLKNKKDDKAFEAKRVEIEQLREQADRGERVLAYCDEAGFSCVHPNRNAWTRIGQQHLIPAVRGQRLNVLGAMLSTGELFSTTYSQPITSEIFTNFVVLLKEHVGEKLTIILDNSSIHKAKSMNSVVDSLKESGVTFCYLSPYSPELNRIETLWHNMKYTWMQVKCRTHEMLKADVQEILDNFGLKYNLRF